MANPISRTAYYTLGVRAADAAGANPMCGDTFAQRFMNDDAQRVWEEFKDFTPPNASNAARHAMIDAHLRRELAADPDATVVIIGAGFDTRAFRLQGGRWFEFDEPEILTYKESRLPAATAPNPLVRVPVNFVRESLAGKLAIVGQPSNVHVVIEGVLMYLTREQKSALLQTLQSRFPHHTLHCDLMRRKFFESYSRPIHEKIMGMGATFTDLVEEPERLFLDAGYTLVDLASIPLYAVDRKSIGIPAFVVRWFLQTLREGYNIAVFRR
ncbi:MAG: class I SAM-dependent methyltransferase [Vicinamibacterales bacterium]|jgi:methyltransferase (TIGR00027 family)